MSNDKISSDTYGLPRDAQETQRLNRQHQFLLQIFGNCHIHPTIDTKKPYLKIADVSCGSGIWLTEVAELYPQAECHGFDISAAQFPSSHHLSLQGSHERVHLHTRDAADPAGPGEEFEGMFDVVNIRIMHINLLGAQWDRAVHNAVAMLKPGGHLQWQDWNCSTVHLVLSKPGTKHPATQELLDGFLDFIKTRDTAPTERIGDMMRKEVMEGVVRETFVPDWDLEARLRTNDELFEGTSKVVRGGLCGRQGSGWDEERIERVGREAKEELKSKSVFVRFDLWWYLGRKPL